AISLPGRETTQRGTGQRRTDANKHKVPCTFISRQPCHAHSARQGVSSWRVTLSKQPSLVTPIVGPSMSRRTPRGAHSLICISSSPAGGKMWNQAEVRRNGFVARHGASGKIRVGFEKGGSWTYGRVSKYSPIAPSRVRVLRRRSRVARWTQGCWTT